MKIILVLMFLLNPTAQPQAINVQVDTIDECFEQAGAFLHSDRAKAAYMAAAGCRLELQGRDAKHGS